MKDCCKLISAEAAVDITYAAVEDKVEKMLQECNKKIIGFAKNGLRGTIINFSSDDYSYIACEFILEKLKAQGFQVDLILSESSTYYVTISW